MGEEREEKEKEEEHTITVTQQPSREDVVAIHTTSKQTARGLMQELNLWRWLSIPDEH